MTAVLVLKEWLQTLMVMAPVLDHTVVATMAGAEGLWASSSFFCW